MNITKKPNKNPGALWALLLYGPIQEQWQILSENN